MNSNQTETMKRLELTEEAHATLMTVLRKYANDNPQFIALNGYPQDPDGVHGLLAILRDYDEVEDVPQARVVKRRATISLYEPYVRADDEEGYSHHSNRPSIVAEYPVVIERAEHPGGLRGLVMVDGKEVPSRSTRIAAESIPFLIEAVRMDLTFRASQWG